MDFSECQDCFYSKSQVKLIFIKCLHCFPTNLIGRYVAVDQSLTAFYTLFGKRWISPVKLTEAFAC